MSYLYACLTLAPFTGPCFILGVVVGWFARRAMRLALFAALLTSPVALDAGTARGASPRPSRREVRIARSSARIVEARTGVAALKWRTRMYRARTAANISGLFSPLSWLFGGVL